MAQKDNKATVSCRRNDTCGHLAKFCCVTLPLCCIILEMLGLSPVTVNGKVHSRIKNTYCSPFL